MVAKISLQNPALYVHDLTNIILAKFGSNWHSSVRGDGQNVKVKDEGQQEKDAKTRMAFETVTFSLNYFISITYPLGFLSSSVSTV